MIDELVLFAKDPSEAASKGASCCSQEQEKCTGEKCTCECASGKTKCVCKDCKHSPEQCKGKAVIN